MKRIVRFKDAPPTCFERTPRPGLRRPRAVAPFTLMPAGIFHYAARATFATIVFAIVATTILLQPPKRFNDFDQPFYLTIAYDINHHGVFSNGIFDGVDSTVAVPPPGKFFAPVYPGLVALVARLDGRFAKTIDCGVEANEAQRDDAACDHYAAPIRIMHAVLLTLGVLAIGAAAEIIFASAAVFWLATGLATLALLPDAYLFALAMTESVTFALYNLAALALVLALRDPHVGRMLLAGVLFGLLALTRPSFAVLAPVAVISIAVNGLWLSSAGWRVFARPALAFALAWMAIVGPWLVRNHVSVGTWGLTEEYGSAALIERFAYDDMSARELALAFPYCLPEIGEPMVSWAFGPAAMERFVYYTPRSFFHVGRANRDRLVEAHGRLDPLIGQVIRDEMRERWWRYLLVSVPLAWCGAWVGGYLGLALVPLFAWGCIAALRRSQSLFLLYAAPALVMLGLHAAVANHTTRYNLILTGPFSAAAAWLIVERARPRPAPTPAPRRPP